MLTSNGIKFCDARCINWGKENNFAQIYNLDNQILRLKNTKVPDYDSHIKANSIADRERALAEAKANHESAQEIARLQEIADRERAEADAAAAAA